jgi:RNA-splicing ligase RtcB
MEIKGKFTTAVVMTENIDQVTYSQILELCNQEMFKGKKIRIMPDCHKGKGSVIGFTAEVGDKICPNIVGVDISCSISAYKIAGITKDNVDFEKLDKVIRQHVPSGTNIRNNISSAVTYQLEHAIREVNKDIGDEDGTRDLKSIGTLGGGNHFIELNEDSRGGIWLCIHCGSRNFGKRICDFHQKKAIKLYQEQRERKRREILEKIPCKERQDALKNIEIEWIEPELRYLEGEDMALYIKHMRVAEDFAKMNHHVIRNEIFRNMGWCLCEEIFTNHNYVEVYSCLDLMIRKGAICAGPGMPVIIPLNMRDGSIIGIGKGNPEWNWSAPHGAGRILSRNQAKSQLSLEEFQKEMNGIWTSCVHNSTLDESPMAYKKKEDILERLEETIEIVDIIKPIYNFKAS